MLLVNREAQIQQLKLSIVPIQKVSPGGAVFPCAPHVLPEAVQRSALLGISLWIVAICVLDVVLERMYPVNLVGGLERHGDHGHLGHDRRWCSFSSEAGGLSDVYCVK